MNSKINIEIPKIKCSISIENFSQNGSILKKSSLSDASLNLCRNQHGDCVMIIVDNNNSKEAKRFTFIKNQENYRLNTKFVNEGKSSILLSDLNLRIFISNCPPNDLSLFLKGLSLKCNYYSSNILGDLKNISNTQLVNLRKSQCSIIEKISPLTSNDLIRNLTYRENLFKNKNVPNQSIVISPVSSKSKYSNKRKLEMTFDKLSNSSPNTKRKIVKSVIPSPVRSLKVLNSNNLTDEQHKVLSAVIHGQSLFFTGSAGTGKSYLLKFIISRLPPDSTFITASTGIAACHIGGITLHMFAGLQISWLEPISINNEIRKLTPKEITEKLSKNEAIVQRWRSCKCLIIDEISMVAGDYFEILDQIARLIRKNDKPFGGIQLVLCGDFLQLPPISKTDNKKKFSFQTKSWTDSIKYCFELRKVKRQSDPTFIKVLQLLRIGRITDSVKNVLIKTSQNNLRKDGKIPTQLYTHRSDVDTINTSQLQKLSTNSKIYSAEDSDSTSSAMLDSICPVPRRLELKIGAQVMLNKNLDLNKGLVNGLSGTIVSFDRDKSSYASQRFLPRIKFINGIETIIDYEKWIVKLTRESKPIYRKHLPLQLAWAISVHKSQGMTISNGVEISLAKVFESGQAYVALSRATSLDNIKLIDFKPENIIANSDAINFYRQLKYV